MSRRLRKIIRREIDNRKERKQYTQQFSQFSDNVAWGAKNNLVSIAYGGGLAQRDGERIRVKGINCKFDLIRDTNNSYAAKIRLVMFWMNRDDTAPQMAEMFDVAGLPLLALRNSEWLNDYVTLMDIVIPIDNTTRTVHYEKYFKMDHLVNYDGINGGDSAKGTIYLTHISDQPPQYPVTMNANIRVIYQDD